MSLQYAVGNAFCAKLIAGTTLSVLFLVFLPLIIVSGIVNLLVYSFHKKQEKKLFFLKHFDAKLSSLEDRKETLFFIAATLETLKKQQKLLQQEGVLEEKKVISEQDTASPLMRDNKLIRYPGSPTTFFKRALGKETVETEFLERIDVQGEDASPVRLLPY